MLMEKQAPKPMVKAEEMEDFLYGKGKMPEPKAQEENSQENSKENSKESFDDKAGETENQAAQEDVKEPQAKKSAKKNESESTPKVRKQYVVDHEVSDKIEEMFFLGKRHIRHKNERTLTESYLFELMVEELYENAFKDREKFLKKIDNFMKRKIN